MTTVFLSGSRKIGRINDQIKKRISTMMEKEFSIVVGDANGADKAMQNYLLENSYERVVVFCAGIKCRNNLGNWETRNVDVPPKLKGRDFYTYKDKAMAAEADYGFVIWDAKSAGSINNVLELVKNQKCVAIYVSPQKQFFTVKNVTDIQNLLRSCDSGDFLNISRKTNLNNTMREIDQSYQGALNL